MTDDKLLELATRCEQATGPDHELDETIAELHEPGMFTRDQYGRMRKNLHGTILTPQWDLWAPPAYTASLDAAMTLVPEDCGVTVYLTRGAKLPGSAALRRYTKLLDEKAYSAAAATPALALCAASLRSLANKETEQ